MDTDEAAREHPFATYVRTLGRGKRGARALTREEAELALRMILDGEATAEQIGAFLMLLRVKEETAAEIAGFASAARARSATPADDIRVDLDWPSYAGKRGEPPWYLLAALLLARGGVRVLLHACAPHAVDRLFALDALAGLGIAPARDWHTARAQLEHGGFAALALASLQPGLQSLLDLRRTLGLRSPVNTFVRHLNPARAPASLQSLHHPAYAALHADAARLLGQPRALVFRGEGGECELRPDAATRCILLQDGTSTDFVMERLCERRAEQPPPCTAASLRALWGGELADPHGVAAVTGTAALGLLACGRESTPHAALAAARQLWDARARSLQEPFRP